MEKRQKYAIGQQDFADIRERGAVYVDKTEYIDRIINSGSKFYFLARPRRFGKSLFLSTLRYFFEGRRDLFKGLYIDSIDWKWEPHPVLRLDLNPNDYEAAGKLEVVVGSLFNHWEQRYEIERSEEAGDLSERFTTLIRTAHERTGKKVVILVDEYDKPLVRNLGEKDNFEYYRSQLASLYSNFKSSGEHIELVFLTGVSRFSRLNVFSDLNNLRDITFSEEYADICGITEQEVAEYFKSGIERLAQKQAVSFEEAGLLLKRNYDGYRFAKTGSDIYNPWSLLNAMEEADIKNFWNLTGTPTIIAESFKRMHADLKEEFDSYCTEEELAGLDLLNPQPTALLYQTGYLTIKDYETRRGRYHLGIPNREVKIGLFNQLLPLYVETKRKSPNATIDEIVFSFEDGKPEEAMKWLQSYFAGIDFKMRMDNENNFHNAFYLLMDLIGLNTETEVHTSDGSIDIKVETRDYIYIIELKYDHSAAEAMHQIKEKNYGRPYQTDRRTIFLIGASFSSKTRCIESWEITQL